MKCSTQEQKAEEELRRIWMKPRLSWNFSATLHKFVSFSKVTSTRAKYIRFTTSMSTSWNPPTNPLKTGVILKPYSCRLLWYHPTNPQICAPPFSLSARQLVWQRSSQALRWPWTSSVLQATAAWTAEMSWEQLVCTHFWTSKRAF